MRTVQSLHGLPAVELLERYYVLLVLRVMLLLLVRIVAEQGLLVVAQLHRSVPILLLVLVLLLGHGIRILLPDTHDTVLRTLAGTVTHTLTRTRARTVTLRCWRRISLWHRIHWHRCTDTAAIIASR